MLDIFLFVAYSYDLICNASPVGPYHRHNMACWSFYDWHFHKGALRNNLGEEDFLVVKRNHRPDWEVWEVKDITKRRIYAFVCMCVYICMYICICMYVCIKRREGVSLEYCAIDFSKCHFQFVLSFHPFYLWLSLNNLNSTLGCRQI